MQQFLKFSTHPIYEIELLPVWISLMEWEGYLASSQCVFYIDNEAAKGSLINGATDQVTGSQLIAEFVEAELRCQTKVWFSRVPTYSNISDGPSRGDLEEMNRMNVKRRYVHWPKVLDKLQRDRIED